MAVITEATTEAAHDDRETVRGIIVVKEIGDGLAYAAGVELSRNGKPYRVFSLYYVAEVEEIYNRQAAVGRAILTAISSLPKGIKRLVIRSPHKLMYGYKKQREKVGGVARIPNRRLDVYMQRVNFKYTEFRRVMELAEDAKQWKSSTTTEL